MKSIWLLPTAIIALVAFREVRAAAAPQQNRVHLISKWTAILPDSWQADPKASELGEKTEFHSVVAGFHVFEKAYVQVRFEKCVRNCEELVAYASNIGEFTHGVGHQCMAQHNSCAPWLPILQRPVGHVCDTEQTKVIRSWGENGLRLLFVSEDTANVMDVTLRQKLLGLGSEQLVIILSATPDEYKKIRTTLDAFVDSITYETSITTNWLAIHYSDWTIDTQAAIGTTDTLDNLSVVAGYTLPSGGYVQVRQGTYYSLGFKNSVKEMRESAILGAWNCCYSERCQRPVPLLEESDTAFICSSNGEIQDIGKPNARFARVKMVRKRDDNPEIVDVAAIKRVGGATKATLTLVILTTKLTAYDKDRVQMRNFLTLLAK